MRFVSYARLMMTSLLFVSSYINASTCGALSIENHPPVARLRQVRWLEKSGRRLFGSVFTANGRANRGLRGQGGRQRKATVGISDPGGKQA